MSDVTINPWANFGQRERVEVSENGRVTEYVRRDDGTIEPNIIGDVVGGVGNLIGDLVSGAVSIPGRIFDTGLAALNSALEAVFGPVEESFTLAVLIAVLLLALFVLTA